MLMKLLNQKHFELAHNVTVPPCTLGIKFERSSSVFPITVCRTVQQFYKVCSYHHRTQMGVVIDYV